MTNKKENIMTSKTVKTVLFANLLAVMVFSFSGLDQAEAKKTDEQSVKKLLQSLEQDAKKYAKQTEKESKQDKIKELKTKYEKTLDKVLEKIEKTNKQDFRQGIDSGIP